MKRATMWGRSFEGFKVENVFVIPPAPTTAPPRIHWDGAALDVDYTPRPFISKRLTAAGPAKSRCRGVPLGNGTIH